MKIYVAFWKQDDWLVHRPRLEDCSMILSVPEDQDDPKQWAIDNGYITQDFGFWECADVTYEITRIQNLLIGER